MVCSVTKQLEATNVNLTLETDLSSARFVSLLTNMGCEQVTVNYDIGNSAALGFDCREELEAYGERITDIHIKDRELGGGSVLLGRGNVDFNQFFTSLEKIDYVGPFIMQAYRDEDGLSVFNQQLEWIKPFLGR